MKTISRREEQILIAIWNLGESAYLLSIRHHLSDILKANWTVGAIHKPLMKLENTGFIKSHMGEATAKRGGRRKKIYTLTRSGLASLDKLKKEYDALWENFKAIQHS